MSNVLSPGEENNILLINTSAGERNKVMFNQAAGKEWIYRCLRIKENFHG